MTSRFRFAAASVVFLVTGLLSGCASPIQHSLYQGRLNKLQLAPRSVYIADIQVIDARPPEELEPLSPQLRYLIPMIIWYQWATEGHVRPDPHLSSTDVVAEMKAVLRTAFHKSGLVAANGEGAGLRVTLRVQHLYGISHASTRAGVTLGAASVSRRDFRPMDTRRRSWRSPTLPETSSVPARSSANSTRISRTSSRTGPRWVPLT